MFCLKSHKKAVPLKHSASATLHPGPESLMGPGSRLAASGSLRWQGKSSLYPFLIWAFPHIITSKSSGVFFFLWLLMIKELQKTNYSLRISITAAE